MLSEQERKPPPHEGGHAVLPMSCRTRPRPQGDDHSDRHALGVTNSCGRGTPPYWREYIEDALTVMMGGRCAEK